MTSSIEAASVTLLWNGEHLQDFKPACGIRQGDPLSPYLFILCMERLAQKIQAAVSEKKWKPVKVGRNGLDLSHLVFADDMLLFTEASVDQLTVVLDVLEGFCHESGQRFNSSKSSLVVARNMP